MGTLVSWSRAMSEGYGSSSYGSAQYGIGDRPQPDDQRELNKLRRLLVRLTAGSRGPAVRPPGQPEQTLAESPPWYNAPSVAVVDLRIGVGLAGPLSEYERMSEVLDCILEAEGARPTDLTAGDASFLASEAELDAGRVAF